MVPHPQGPPPPPFLCPLRCAGYLPCPKLLRPTPDTLGTPVLMLHGEEDLVVREEWARSSHQALVAAGFTATAFRSFPDLDHSISPEELTVAVAFLKQCLEAK